MFAEDTRIVKASFKGCPLDERKIFYRSTCLLPISVGQPVHETKKLLATLKLVNASFRSCTVLVGDILQRHTLRLRDTISGEQACYQKALEEGDKWLERNGRYLAQLAIPCVIERWSKWLEHPRYKKQFEIINSLYATDIAYRKSVDESIETYLHRNQKNKEQSGLDNTDAFASCLAYLLEECTAMCLWVEEGCEFELYPAGRNQAMAATYERLIRPFYPSLLRPVAIRFKKGASEQVSDDIKFHKGYYQA